MSEVTKEQAVQPFFRSGAARPSPGDGGFGLGLSIVRAIIKEHGGTVAFSDSRPSGLLVTVALPT